MDKQLEPTEGKVKIINDANEFMPIRRQLLETVTNKAGVVMWKYTYWKICADKVYRISEPDEYDRILKSLNNADVIFVKIGDIYVNKRTIKTIESKVGYQEKK